MKVLVCGASAFQDKEKLFDALDALHAETPVTLVINGGARGADLFSSQWARAREIPLKIYRTNRYQHGADAFFALNAKMLAEQKPDLVLACGGRGITEDLLKRARSAGIAVRQV